ncbi:MAG: tetratricopeptide repeat protein [Phycisphaerae bacterium]|nr:tetratricopeptide repeat protein [Phycisphaerae bacterium]
MNASQAYRCGMAAYHAADYEQAIKALEPLVQQSKASPNPESTDAHDAVAVLGRFYFGQANLKLAKQHFQRKRYQDAIELFKTAAKLNPIGGGVEQFLAACYAKTGQFDLAAENLQEVLDQHPHDVTTRIRLALNQWRQGSPDAAMQTLTDGIDRHPNSAELHYQLGCVYASCERFDDAERCFVTAIDHDANHAAAHERLAQCCSLRGDHARALELLQRASELKPHDARVGIQLSLLARGVGNLKQVDSAMQTKTTMKSAESSAPCEMLDSEAIRQLGEMIVENPEFVDAFLSLPPSEVDEEIFSTLAATLEHALAQHPEYADLHYHCGQVYRRLGKHDDAVAHIEQAVSMNPNYVSALIFLARLYAQSHRKADSIDRLEEAIRRGADYADVHDLLGRLYQQTGQPKAARTAFKRALAINSNFEAAQEALRSLETVTV